jgi:hypothetical protein
MIRSIALSIEIAPAITPASADHEGQRVVAIGVPDGGAPLRISASERHTAEQRRFLADLVKAAIEAPRTAEGGE